MSDIRVNTISAANGTDPVTLTKQSAAKVWASYDQYYANVLRDSFNISSAVDVSTGRCQFNISSAFDTGDYSVNVTGKLVAIGFLSTAIHGSSTPTSSQYECALGNTSASVDCPYVFSSAHGDLA